MESSRQSPLQHKKQRLDSKSLVFDFWFLAFNSGFWFLVFGFWFPDNSPD